MPDPEAVMPRPPIRHRALAGVTGFGGCIGGRFERGHCGPALMVGYHDASGRSSFSSLARMALA